MSNHQTADWLDAWYKKFQETEDGRKRAYVLQIIRENGFDEDADNIVEGWHEEQLAFMKERGISYSELHIDEDGDEFYFDEFENGNPGEDGYSVDTKAIKLPDHLQVNKWKEYTYPYRHDDLVRLKLND